MEGYMSNTRNRFSPGVRARAVRMVMEHESDYASRWAAILSISSKIGCAPQTLNNWIKTFEMGSGVRAGVPTEVAKKLKALERENKELQRAMVGYFARLRRISLRRSSTAPSKDDPFYR